MKKLINDPADVVIDALRGMAAAHPELRVDLEQRIVFRADAPAAVTARTPSSETNAAPGTSAASGKNAAPKVGLVSGGGSGHEPLHAGFVGLGMLDAACAGEVFTSPVPDQILEATRRVDGGAGVLHIVKNYTGDVMNFEMAAELADAEGLAIESVVVDDDVAVRDSTWTAGRRGVGLTVLLEKIVGAGAEQGRDLTACAELARRVNAAGRSMGVALTSCTVPAAGRPTFDLPEDELELGVGIHGEPGRERVPLGPASEVARMLVEPILDDLDFSGDGGRDLLRQRPRRDSPDRALPDVRRGRGAPRSGGHPDRAVARRAVHHQPRHGRLLGQPAARRRGAARSLGCSCPDTGTSMGGLSRMAELIGAAGVRRWLAEFARLIEDNAARLTELDAAIGDADHGSNMQRGMAAVQRALDELPADARPDTVLKTTAMTLISSVGGASGPLYGTLFLRMSTSVGTAESLDGPVFAAALRAGVSGVVARGKASSGDKTMYDALGPACDALDGALGAGDDLGKALVQAVRAAEMGRDAVTPLVARKGRASYLGQRSADHQDPGATSAALLITAAASALMTADPSSPDPSSPDPNSAAPSDPTTND